jgi:transcriptional regulator with XRE-family HTH domain
LSQVGIVSRLAYEASPLYPAQISNYEQGKREPPLQLLLAYARLAGIPLEILADDEMDLPARLPAKPKLIAKGRKGSKRR